jgi:hypothetical protein
VRCTDIPAFSVQHHPEAGPGPHDSAYLFSEFAAQMERHRKGLPSDAAVTVVTGHQHGYETPGVPRSEGFS